MVNKSKVKSDPIRVRRATLADAGAIRSIIAPYARHRVMLPRPKREVCEHIRDFFLATEGAERFGCCGLRVWTARCAEIYGLAVRRSSNRRGIGSRLVRVCLREARRLGVRRVLAFTSERTWFSRLGFRHIPLKMLPHVVYREKFIRGERAVYLDLPRH